MASPQNKYLIGPLVLDCNRGDQALVWEAIDLIKHVDPDAEIAIMAEEHEDLQSSQSKQTRARGIKILPSILPNPRRFASKNKIEIHDAGFSLIKMKIRAMLDYLQMQLLLQLPSCNFVAKLLLGTERYKTYSYLKKCNALVIKGGGFIYALPGFRWFYFIWFGLFSLMMAQKLGVKTIILPNSFGPFENARGKLLAKKTLEKCDLVVTREHQSFDKLEELLPGKAFLTPDMAFNLPVFDKKWGQDELVRHKIPLGQPCIGLTMRPWRFPDVDVPNEKYENYIDSHARFINYLTQKGYHVVLFAHVTGPHAHEDDRIVLRELMKRLRGTEKLFYIDGDYNCYQMKSLYSFMDFMVCTRFHSAIFSLSQNIPCLVISYQGTKATGIMADMGLSEYVIGINEVNYDKLITLFDKLESNRQDSVKIMKSKAEEINYRLENLKQLYKEALVTTSMKQI